MSTPASHPRLLRIFLCHSSADKPFVRELYQRLKQDGFQPWLDEYDLAAGQLWQEEISAAVRACDAVIVCLSKNSTGKEGYVQKEIKIALDIADEKPPDIIFLIPLRLESIQIPERLRKWHCVDYFRIDGVEREHPYHQLRRALDRRAAGIGVASAPSALVVTPSNDADDILLESESGPNANALCATANQYFTGEGVEQSYEQALDWYQKAAAAGSSHALFEIGQCYQYGLGVRQDTEKARMWYQKGADADDPSAMATLGIFYHTGEGVTLDYEVARKWYEKAADAGSSIATVNLGILYGNKQAYERAYYWYERAADAGNAEAMNCVGDLYSYGHGVKQDHEQARYWYEKSADAGSKKALTNLGRVYECGLGVKPDGKQARKWYQKAAAEGEAVAMVRLGRLCCFEQHYDEARNWFEKGASNGYPSASTELGWLYDYGRGVSTDYEVARQWYLKAAAKGEARAMMYLGQMYSEGKGVKQDYHQTRYWFQKAADAGDDLAGPALELFEAMKPIWRLKKIFKMRYLTIGALLIGAILIVLYFVYRNS